MHLREATPDDRDLLADLLVDAVDWTGQGRSSRERVLADPHTSRYVVGWPEPGDFGTVAVGEDDAPLGAVWARALPPERPGYGFVAPDVPELSMAVLAGSRGRGIGTALMAAVVGQARARGWPALSLSVEDGNHVARALYERHGFRVVGRTGGSDTMLLDLRPHPTT